MSKKFECIEQRDSAAKMRCLTCGIIFFVDACYEENLIIRNGHLIEKCPGCGEVREGEDEGVECNGKVEVPR